MFYEAYKMKKGVFVAPTINEFSDPQNLVDLAVMTEEAGWDGYFICDQDSTSNNIKINRTVTLRDNWK